MFLDEGVSGCYQGRWARTTAMTDKDEVLLNSKEVAEILDLSPDTVNELARKSVLPAFKRGRQWRFRKRDIVSYKRESWGATAA
jgi:excisionase family DNA binding protein